MSDYDSSIMIALLPDEAKWVKQDLPHLTIVFGGDIPDAKSGLLGEMVAMTTALGLSISPMRLWSSGVRQFGEGDERVDVLTFEPNPDLLHVRSCVEKWSKSQYKFFNPHVTIGPVGSASATELPRTVVFDKLLLAWGDRHFKYDLEYQV